MIDKIDASTYGVVLARFLFFDEWCSIAQKSP